jgi:hypothetical protein
MHLDDILVIQHILHVLSVNHSPIVMPSTGLVLSTWLVFQGSFLSYNCVLESGVLH